MASKHSGAQSHIKWTDKVTACVAGVAIVLSVISLALSCTSNRIAQEGNNIASTAEAHNETQDAQQLEAHVEARTFIARSLDLLAEEDKSFWEAARLAPHIIKTPYWQSEQVAYNIESKKGYLFVFIINNGPGMASKLRFSEIRWYPKQGFQLPTGVRADGELGILRSEHFYALLVNVLAPVNPGVPWGPTNFDLKTADYEWVYFDVIFEDALRPDNPLPILLGQNPELGIATPWPASIEPES
jgi:hypothetical protein